MTQQLSLEYCFTLAREHAYAEYLCAAVLPAESRPAAMALLALDTELRLIPAKVHEEMLAHIRFAWWREGIEAIAKDEKPREHPVLQAMAEYVTPVTVANAIIDEAQNAYPAQLAAPTQAYASSLRSILGNNAARWEKAHNIAKRHCDKRRALLILKLLFFAR